MGETAAREASFYEVIDKASGKVRCLLCPKQCVLAPEKRGFCRARVNVGGRLVATTYGECTSIAIDPVEKKPLYHFYPGHTVLSVGAAGCNLACKFCQNWTIAQEECRGEPVTPDMLVEAALDRPAWERCVGIAYTYSEPVVWYEFVYDTARVAREAGLKNVLVTNGEISPDPLRELLSYLDALNIDVKSFTESFYQKVCAGSLEPVLRSAELAKAEGAHVEITNLLIPTLNDSDDEIQALTDWVAERLGPKTPVHFSRYFPQYKMNLPPTPVKTLERAAKIARQKLHYVYIGNVRLDGNDTLCPECGATVIKRVGFSARAVNLSDGLCTVCGARIYLTGDVARQGHRP